MKRFRSNRRPGNKPMTKAELCRVMDAKFLKCIPCLVWATAGNMPMEDVATYCEYDHSKSGNIRRGHDKGFASCLWHHRRVIEVEGWTFSAMTKHFGPSLLDGSALFRRTYGTDDELIALQNQLLEAA